MISEHRHLGAPRFPSDLTDIELDFFFTLDDAELELVRRRQRDLNRVGLALQLGFLKMTGGGMPVSERVPAMVLAHVCAQLSADPIDIASVASMYRRRATRFAHQAEAARFLGLSEIGPGGRAGLVRYLNAEAATDPDPEALLRNTHMWMHTRHYLMIGSRASGDIVGQVILERERRLSRMITRSWTGAPGWVVTLAEHVVPNVTRLEWLSAGPRRKSLAALEEQVGKISCLKAMGAGRIDLDGLTDVAIARHARSVILRKASVLHIYKEPRLRIAIACFLERQLRIQTDSAIDLYNHLVNDLVRRAHDRGMERVARSAASVANLVVDIERLAVDPDVSVEDVQARLLALIAPFRGPGALAVNRTQAMREELSAQMSEIRRLLRIFDAIDLDMPPEHPLTVARKVIASTEMPGARLPDAIDNPFGAAWAGLIAADDRKTAFTSWCAATALLIKRSLRNGSANIPHSRTWKDPDRHLIPGALWERDRGRFRRKLIREISSETFLKRIERGLDGGLKELARAVSEGRVRIEDGMVSLLREDASPVDPEVTETRRRILAAIGSRQLPDVIVEVDRLAGFGKTLLGRRPRSAREAVVLYAAIVALGSDLEAADIERMVQDLSAASVGAMMRRIETSGRLREANELLAKFVSGLEISALWGKGVSASSDMMSLDATRMLWSARADPRRRTASMGAYTHVADHWALIHDQPIVLNQRQAGAAIEGALRQDVAEIDRLAVDTHGVTHFSMALAKLLGFDICPRLARLPERKLYAFRDTKVPAILEPIVSRTLSRRSVALGWDGLLRVAASTQGGWCSAVWAVDRHSSASTGLPVYRAGDTLGKLLRSSFLCDYLATPAFRSEIQRLLNQGEGSHRLQRAIHNGPIRSRKGRTREQMTAISGALTLLTNIVIAWNTAQFQSALKTHCSDRPKDYFRHIAPIAPPISTCAACSSSTLRGAQDLPDPAPNEQKNRI